MLLQILPKWYHSAKKQYAFIYLICGLITMLKNLEKEINKLKNKEKAKVYARFFKTGKGQYSEGDIFLGLTVPEQRKIALRYLGLSLKDLSKLLHSRVHEYRFTALEILVVKYEKGDLNLKNKIANFYLKNTKYINNWDLVDTSAPYILGDYLLDKDKSILFSLAKSSNLWEKRIAIISTFRFIKENKFDETLKISKILLKDKHDLIHKAIGWMLREIGKKDEKTEENFLKENYKDIPRTTLRYAIERFDNEKKKFYMNMKAFGRS